MIQAPVPLRPYASGFAVVLGFLATWIIAAELVRPSPVSFPADTGDARALQNSMGTATTAWLGWPRGELWSDYAVTANSGLIVALNASGLSPANEHGNDVAEVAARLAPWNARTWLLLALNAVAASNDPKALALLKMSYYTSPYSDALFPVRIQVASRTPGISDEELDSFAEYEIGVVVSQKSDLKKFIASAYRAASPAGRIFFDRALTKLDPGYLAELKAAKK